MCIHIQKGQIRTLKILQLTSEFGGLCKEKKKKKKKKKKSQQALIIKIILTTGDF